MACKRFFGSDGVKPPRTTPPPPRGIPLTPRGMTEAATGIGFDEAEEVASEGI